MATWYFKPTATDIGDVNSYAPNPDYSGAAPGALADLAADDIYLNEGHLTINAGVTALAAIDINSWTIGPMFDGSFGSEGGAVQLLGTSGSPSQLRIDAPRANVYIAATATMERATISGGRVYFTAGTFSDVRMYGGRLFVNDCIVTSLFQSGGISEAIYKSTAFTNLILVGGTCLTKRNATTATIDGPSARLTTMLAAALTTANVQGGGVLNLRGQPGTSVGTLNTYRGTVTPQDALGDQAVTTLNNYGGPEAVRIYSTWGLRAITAGTTNDYGGAGTLANPKGGGSEGFTP